MAVERTIAVEPTLDALERVAPEASSDLQRAMRKLLRRPPALFGLFCVIVVVTWAVVPGLFAPLSPLDQSLDRYLKPRATWMPRAGPTGWARTSRGATS